MNDCVCVCVCVCMWVAGSYLECPTCPGTGPPRFKSANINSALQATGADGSVVISFSVPGIYYWAVSGDRSGAGTPISSAGGTGSPYCEGCVPYVAPLALIVPGSDGKPGNDSLPAGFAGQTMTLSPLASPYQLCLVTFNVTVFSGSRIYLPLCAGSDAGGASQAALEKMKFGSVRHPAWMTVYFTGTPANSSVAERRAVDAEGQVVTTAPLLRVSQLLDFTHLPIWLQFHAAAAPAPPFMLQVCMHATSTPPSSTSKTWQTLTAAAVATPTVKLPEKLITSVTWAYDDMLLTSPDGSLSMVDTYSSLGFNTVPFLSTQAYWFPGQPQHSVFGPKPSLLYPGNRTAGPWKQSAGALKFGPQHSGFSEYFRFTTGKSGPPNATILTSMGVQAAELPAEMLKWERAINFSQSCGGMPDIAYDGALLKADNQEFCDMVGFVQPDFVFADDEGWGNAWAKWHKKGYMLKSKNALAQRLPGESDENLAFRMTVQMLAGWVSCLQKVSPATQPMWYGTALAPAEAFEAAGVIPQYSTYSDIFAPVTWPTKVKRQKQLIGDKAPLVPWLTSCCWGQMNADELRSATLHSFGSGASGFSWFRDICFDDPGKLLALSDAIAVAGHHEEHLSVGMPALVGEEFELRGEKAEAPIAWSASVANTSMWLAFTSGRQQTALRFAVALDPSGERSTQACVVSTANRTCEPALMHHPLKNTRSRTKWEEYAVPIPEALKAATVVLYVSPIKTDDDTLRRAA
jgi:hypothetical protein